MHWIAFPASAAIFNISGIKKNKKKQKTENKALTTSAGKWINYCAGKTGNTLEQNHVN